MIVVAFLGVECPLAKLYAARLNDLQEKFAADQVAFVGIDANPQDSLSEMAAFVRRQELAYPCCATRPKRSLDNSAPRVRPKCLYWIDNAACVTRVASMINMVLATCVPPGEAATARCD